MPENQSLHDLILLIKDGDHSIVDDIAIQVRQLLFNHLLWRYPTLFEEDVKDVIQETTIIIFACADQYRGPNAEGWVYKIAHSKASKIAREKKRFDEPLESDDDFSPASERNLRMRDKEWDGDNSVENRALRSSAMKDIEKETKRLSLDEQNILHQRYKEDATFEEIGKGMGRSKVRAKQKHDGAVAKIRSILRLD